MSSKTASLFPQLLLGFSSQADKFYLKVLALELLKLLKAALSKQPGFQRTPLLLMFNIRLRSRWSTRRDSLNYWRHRLWPT